MKKIYYYTDPIAYLRAWKKSNGTSFSKMAQDTTIRAKSFFHKLFTGEKVYSMKRAIPIGMMLGLGTRELKYFEVMSLLHKAQSPLKLKREVLNKFRPKRFRS